MSRFLFVVPPLSGHINPTLAVGAELLSRGHEVAWAGYPSSLSSVLPKDSRIFPTDAILSSDALDGIALSAQNLRGAEAFQFLWRNFIIPLADATLPEVDAAVEQFSPDILIVDQQAIAGSLVGRRRNLRWATSATTSSELVDSFSVFPLFRSWLENEMRAFQDRSGISPAAQDDLRFSKQLVLAFSARELVGKGPFPTEWKFVGPAVEWRRPAAPSEFPWGWLDPTRKHVLLTLGTVSASSGRRFFELAIEIAARCESQLQMVVVAPDGMLLSTTANVLILARVPQLQLLPQIDAVICHAGHNTVCEALAEGIPLLVAPIRDDQPIIAQQVVDVGAGIRVKYGRVTCDELESALIECLEIPSYRQAAQRIQQAFREAGGSATAADHLELLTGTPQKEAVVS